MNINHYTFPFIENRNDVVNFRPIIGNVLKELKLQYFNIITWDYENTNLSSDTEHILRDIRGIVFDKSGRVLVRPMHLIPKGSTGDFRRVIKAYKWNYGQIICPVYIAKYNGFRLIQPNLGITQIAKNAEVFVSENSHYFRFFRMMEKEGLTPSFKWDPKNQLNLISVREKISGKYKDIDEYASDVLTLEKIKIDKITDHHLLVYDDGHMFLRI
jgi:hypothetical protein